MLFNVTNESCFRIPILRPSGDQEGQGRGRTCEGLELFRT
jgi:hypothetical protein